MTEESEHTAGRDGTGQGCAVAAACSLLFLSSAGPLTPHGRARLSLTAGRRRPLWLALSPLAQSRCASHDLDLAKVL